MATVGKFKLTNPNPVGWEAPPQRAGLGLKQSRYERGVAGKESPDFDEAFGDNEEELDHLGFRVHHANPAGGLSPESKGHLSTAQLYEEMNKRGRDTRKHRVDRLRDGGGPELQGDRQRDALGRIPYWEGSPEGGLQMVVSLATSLSSILCPCPTDSSHPSPNPNPSYVHGPPTARIQAQCSQKLCNGPR